MKQEKALSFFQFQHLFRIKRLILLVSIQSRSLAAEILEEKWISAQGIEMRKPCKQNFYSIKQKQPIHQEQVKFRIDN